MTVRAVLLRLLLFSLERKRVFIPVFYLFMGYNEIDMEAVCGENSMGGDLLMTN